MGRPIHFEIQADDPERAKSFYENAFGWKIEKWSGESVGMDYWMLTTGPDGVPGINGGMYKRPADKKLNTYDCTIAVEDIDEAIQAIKANGGEIQPWEGKEKWEMAGIGWFTRARDTEGNIFGVLQPTSWQPK